MKEWLSKIWGRLLCGKPREGGNYARYWGKQDGENDIFEIGPFHSIVVDWLDKKGQWASHPLDKYLE